MILLLLAANILFALPLAVPVFLFVVQTTGHTLFAERMFADKIDAVWFSDIVNGQTPDWSALATGAEVGLMLLVLGATYLLLYTFFAGGILEVYNCREQGFSMRKFFSGCGANFWRFFRLSLFSVILYGLALGIYLLIMWPINSANSTATTQRPVVFEKYAAGFVFLLLLWMVNMIVDYGRIGAVVNRRNRMFKELLKSSRFVFRHFLKTFSLYVILAVAGLILFFVFAWLRGVIPQSSILGVGFAFIIGQIALASRMWARLAFYAGELDLYRQLVPVVTAVKEEAETEIEEVAAASE